MLRIALVYKKCASADIAGMDLIRWTEIGSQFLALGCEVDLVTHQPDGVSHLRGLPVRDARAVNWDDYDAVKVCYHHSIDLVPPHRRMTARLCRVVDETLPARDSGRRAEILEQQDRISEIATFVAVNDAENANRWRARYGDAQQLLIVPGACPEVIPKPQASPYRSGRRIVLFCGSLTSQRFPAVLNRVAKLLLAHDQTIEVHLVGRDRLHLYGGAAEPLDPNLVHIHPPVDHLACWQYIHHADVGLALAPSSDSFEGELTKIYYYLRGGLPVVTESAALNCHLVEETGHGRVVNYDDSADLVQGIVAALELPTGDAATMRYMRTRHSWRQRAQVHLRAWEGHAAVNSKEGV